jgi:hypothetical protein
MNSFSIRNICLRISVESSGFPVLPQDANKKHFGEFCLLFFVVLNKASGIL